MRHLVLKQTTDITESVENTCINDLYALDELDNTSSIVGKINTQISSFNKINTLHTLDNNNQPVAASDNVGRWENLFATASAYAMEFEDDEWARICATTWGDGQVVTRQQMAAVNYLPDRLAVDNSDLEVIDLGICIMSQADYARRNALSNCPNVRKIIIGGVTTTTNVSGFASIMNKLGTTHLDKYVTGDCTSIPGEGSNGDQTIDVLGIKRVGQYKNDVFEVGSIGNYWTRGGRTINKLYIWSNTPPTYSGAYGDDASKVGVQGIFVPDDMVETYINNTSFNPNGQFTERIYGYNFDLDPDEVYKELKK